MWTLKKQRTCFAGGRSQREMRCERAHLLQERAHKKHEKGYRQPPGASVDPWLKASKETGPSSLHFQGAEFSHWMSLGAGFPGVTYLEIAAVGTPCYFSPCQSPFNSLFQIHASYWRAGLPSLVEFLSLLPFFFLFFSKVSQDRHECSSSLPLPVLLTLPKRSFSGTSFTHLLLLSPEFSTFFFYFHLFCLQSLPIFWEEKASLNLLKHSFTRISPLEWKFQEGFCAQYCILSYSILTTLSFRIEPGSWWILKSVFVGRLDSCFSSVYSQCFLSLTSFTYHCL